MTETREELGKIEVELCPKCAGHGMYYSHGVPTSCEYCDSTGVVSSTPAEKKNREGGNERKL
jgi:DnaJ-class molecular chaperone